MSREHPVPRETPPAPDVARGVFGSRMEKATAFAELLATEGVVRGLLGPRESGRLWERHLLNCAVLTDLLPVGTQVCDLGSGAGLPGLVLAIRRPDLRVTLVEPLLRRSTFLGEAVGQLALDNVEVWRARAENLRGQADFDVVTSRAVAPLPRLLDWSMPLVRRGGEVLAMKGSSAADEAAAAASDVRRWTDASAEVLTIGADSISVPTTVVRVVATRSSRLGLAADSPARSRSGRDAGRRPRRGRAGDTHG